MRSVSLKPRREAPVIWPWGLAAIVALLSPSRSAGSLAGMPLDGVAEAILIGVVFPALWFFHPAFLRTRLARGSIVALIAWKALATIALVPEGWCVRFEPGRPLVRDATSAVPHSWDVRADWLADPPACSAVMRRAYTGLGEFPVWFFNLPPAGGGYPVAGDRPPTARTAMTVTGFLDAPRAGELRLGVGDDMRGMTTAFLDGQPFGDTVRVEAGTHRIRVDALLVESGWRFVPLWNGNDFWSSSATGTLTRPGELDGVLRPAGRWFVTLVVWVWMIAWIASFVARIGSPVVLVWMVGASASLGVLVAAGHLELARWAVPALAAAALLPVPARLRNLTGACVLLGVPWLTLIVVWSAGDIGRFWFYGIGHDYWTYQRYAYRIVMQGYWLEGGSPLFWFQPLYRWIVGLLHLVFGDSSVGERFWDGACVLATALFAWRIADAYAGFRAGLIAAVLTLGVMTLATPWSLIGLGLGELSSMGLLSVAAMVAWRSRRGSWATAIGAGILATLALYTRLNAIPMALALASFALPVRLTVRDLFRTSPWRLPIAWRTAVAIPLVVAAGLLLFAWRTWHYSGVFSILYGTSQQFLAIWQPGMSAGRALIRGVASAMMVLTVNDPAQFDWQALPVLAGAAAAVLALLGVPRFRELPAGPTLLFFAGISSAFVSRGWAYPGRFSVHIIAVTCALTVCAAASLTRRPGLRSAAGQRQVRETGGEEADEPGVVV
jgi:hypothetical protein